MVIYCSAWLHLHLLIWSILCLVIDSFLTYRLQLSLPAVDNWPIVFFFLLGCGYCLPLYITWFTVVNQQWTHCFLLTYGQLFSVADYLIYPHLFSLYSIHLQSGAKIVRLIAKEILSGPYSPIINVELEFEGSGQALHYFSTLIWGERGGNWVVSRIFAPDCLYFLRFWTWKNFSFFHFLDLFSLT